MKEKMVKIRLARVGRTKRPHFRLVVTEHTRPSQSNYLEILGNFHPAAKDETKQFVFNEDRIKYWLSKGAKPSDTVNNLLAGAGLLPKSAVIKKTVKPKAKKEGEEKAPKPTPEEIKAAQGETAPAVETPLGEAKTEKSEEKPKEAESQSEDKTPEKQEVAENPEPKNSKEEPKS